jgi:hypothetical protein
VTEDATAGGLVATSSPSAIGSIGAAESAACGSAGVGPTISASAPAAASASTRRAAFVFMKCGAVVHGRSLRSSLISVVLRFFLSDCRSCFWTIPAIWMFAHAVGFLSGLGRAVIVTAYSAVRAFLQSADPTISNSAPPRLSSRASVSAASGARLGSSAPGAPSTSVFASLRPSPVAVRTALITWIFFGPESLRRIVMPAPSPAEPSWVPVAATVGCGASLAFFPANSCFPVNATPQFGHCLPVRLPPTNQDKSVAGWVWIFAPQFGQIARGFQKPMA